MIRALIRMALTIGAALSLFMAISVPANATSYGSWYTSSRSVVFLDGTVYGGLCHFYAKATQTFNYRLDNAKRSNAQVKNVSTTTAASGCPLNSIKLRLGSTSVSNVTEYGGPQTQIRTPFTLTLTVGIPTPWGTIGKSADESGYMYTDISPSGKFFTNFYVTDSL